MGREFTVVVEKDPDGYYVASVLELSGCHTQGKTLDEVMERIHEAIVLCLEVQKMPLEAESRFVGIHRVAV